jgi:hypothetical protein
LWAIGSITKDDREGDAIGCVGEICGNHVLALLSRYSSS